MFPVAVFQMKDEETWLPEFARGKGIKAQHVKLHHRNGTRPKKIIPAGPGPRRITVTNSELSGIWTQIPGSQGSANSSRRTEQWQQEYPNSR